MQIHYLKSGEVLVVAQPALITTIVGSCIAVLLYDARAGVGGINHYVHPFAPPDKQYDLMYGRPALQHLLREFRRKGGTLNRAIARVYGGGYHPNMSNVVGLQNETVAKDFLAEHRIRMVDTQCGGARGRKIIFSTDDGAVTVTFAGTRP